MLAGVVGANNSRLTLVMAGESRSANSVQDSVRQARGRSVTAKAKGGTMSSQVSALRLFDLIQSHRVTAGIYVRGILVVPQFLRDGPQTPGNLANGTEIRRVTLSNPI